MCWPQRSAAAADCWHSDRHHTADDVHWHSFTVTLPERTWLLCTTAVNNYIPSRHSSLEFIKCSTTTVHLPVSQVPTFRLKSIFLLRPPAKTLSQASETSLKLLILSCWVMSLSADEAETTSTHRNRTRCHSEDIGRAYELRCVFYFS